MCVSVCVRYLHMDEHVCICICMHMCIWMCMSVYTCAYLYVYACEYVLHVYVQMHGCSLNIIIDVPSFFFVF